MDNLIITIGRQFGSGGLHVGKQLAAELGLPCYDRELIKIAAEDSGLSEELFENADEKPVNSFLYSIVTQGMSSFSTPIQYGGLATNDKLFAIQAGIIKKIANEKPCVIIGRCADDILRDYKNLIRVYIHAEKKEKVLRIMEEFNLSPKSAEDAVRKINKSRAAYYEFFANKKWGDLKNYDITLNSSIGIDNCVKILKEYVKINYSNGEGK